MGSWFGTIQAESELGLILLPRKTLAYLTLETVQKVQDRYGRANDILTKEHCDTTLAGISVKAVVYRRL